MCNSIELGDLLALGALLLTTVALAFALYAVIKEFSTRKIDRKLDVLEKRMDDEISGLRLGLVIEEMCGKYLMESGIDRAREMQTVRVLLFRVVYASKRDELLSTFLSLNGHANPYYKEFFSELRAFYMSLWSSGRWHGVKLDEEFRQEFLGTFGEDIDTAITESYLWEFLRKPASAKSF